MQKLLAGLMLLAVPVSEVPLMPDQYSLLCEGEQATGFNWVGGQWVKANFKPDRYLVVNSGQSECAFRDVPNKELIGESGFFTREVCLNIRKFGTELKPQLSEKCREFYVIIAEKWSKQFACDGLLNNFEGNFEGDFRKISESNINPGVVRRDSMVLEVGKCSRIS